MRPSDYVNSDRLWANLMELAEIGAIDGGGVNRQALTEKNLMRGNCASNGLLNLISDIPR